MHTETITADRLNSVAYLAGLSHGLGTDTRRQAEAVVNSIVRDARAEHYPAGPFLLSFAEGYHAGRNVADAEQDD